MLKKSKFDSSIKSLRQVIGSVQKESHWGACSHNETQAVIRRFYFSCYTAYLFFPLSSEFKGLSSFEESISTVLFLPFNSFLLKTNCSNNAMGKKIIMFPNIKPI
jgi:glycopeptide antibiotics resistance protein